MSKTNLRTALALAGLALGALPLRAYVLITDESGVYTNKWYATPIVMQLKLSNFTNLSDGQSQQSTAAAAMTTWNAQMGGVQFSPTLMTPTAYANGNGVNEIVMDRTVDGDAFPVGTLAITVSYGGGNDYTEADIVINNDYTWDSYRGPQRLNGTQDLQRVLLHELGHVLGLDHPDQRGQSVSAIMNSRADDNDRLQSDDIAGARSLYGAPGAGAPANDLLANAISITLVAGTAQVTGSNVAATRETGEPRHATSTSTHSIWWKWTAPTTASMTARTFGSDFDTVLGVYTGATVGALARIVDNDDEEEFDQFPNDPARKRTSRVTFNATAGTTYYFAVDGWGSVDYLESGYHGAITLALNLAGAAAPVFSTQPAPAVAALGASPTLTAAASGSAAVQWQWQQNGVAITGATQDRYTLPDLQPACAGIYTAVATIGASATTSSPVIVGPLTTTKVVGAGSEVGTNIVHVNGNVYDQVLLSGAAAGVTADATQVLRISYVDLTNDIVQVEFAGAGTLSLVLDAPTGPAAPVNYNQPGVTYMKGNPGIVITGANETTNVSVFSVGKINAVNQALFKDTVTYDGFADLAFIAISSTNGKFGGIRTANAGYVATRGPTGIYAPGVQFTGPVFVGNIYAFNTAAPVLVLGSASNVRITGGDMRQFNNAPVQVSGITQLVFDAGSSSHGRSLPAQVNRARFEQDGVDVTTQIVVNPTP